MLTGAMTEPVKRQSKRVCIRDVAEVCGVSAMTVSNALRGAHRVALPTRRRIVAAAERLGYRPDPELSRTMSKLRGERVADAPCIAWVDTGASDNLNQESVGEILSAAESRATERGFVLTCLSLEDSQVSSARMLDILHARGVDCGLFTSGTERVAAAWVAEGKNRSLWMGSNAQVVGLPRVHFADVSDYLLGFHKLAGSGYRQLLVHQSTDTTIEAALFEAALHRCRSLFSSVRAIGDSGDFKRDDAVAAVSLHRVESEVGLPLFIFGESSLPKGAGGYVRSPARLGRAVIDTLAQQYLSRKEQEPCDILLRAEWQMPTG